MRNVMGISNWLSKFVNYYRKNGFLWLCCHILTNLIHYNELVILETDIIPEHRSVEAKIPINIHLLTNTDEDINRLMSFWPENEYVPPFSTPQMIREIIGERLSVGEQCMIAEYKGKIIHMNWIGLYGHHMFDSYEEKRGLFPGEAISHSVYCSDAFRGNHIMSAVRTKVFDYLLERGFKRVVGYVDPDNKASMKVNLNFGAKPLQKIYNLKILGYNLNYLTKNKF